MEFIATDIPDVYIIQPKIFKDERGIFIKTFNKDLFDKYNLECEFKESFYSFSKKDVIRGMHFQLPPNDHAKLIYVITGRIIDVVLDIRKNSPAYGQFISVELSAENNKQIYIPRGCAHGFVAISEEESCVVYMQTTVYVPEADTGIRFDSFGMNWNVKQPIVSQRDLNFKPLNEFVSPF
jgi:dTDP-4-dehydrorhamnose 3,5-epimerase/CDP-3, 6-dideoxy-D-glycero-D-glycero-4-hexulose-5-epimerase